MWGQKPWIVRDGGRIRCFGENLATGLLDAPKTVDQLLGMRKVIDQMHTCIDGGPGPGIEDKRLDDEARLSRPAALGPASEGMQIGDFRSLEAGIKTEGYDSPALVVADARVKAPDQGHVLGVEQQLLVVRIELLVGNPGLEAAASQFRLAAAKGIVDEALKKALAQNGFVLAAIERRAVLEACSFALKGVARASFSNGLQRKQYGKVARTKEKGCVFGVRFSFHLAVARMLAAGAESEEHEGPAESTGGEHIYLTSTFRPT